MPNGSALKCFLRKASVHAMQNGPTRRSEAVRTCSRGHLVAVVVELARVERNETGVGIFRRRIRTFRRVALDGHLYMRRHFTVNADRHVELANSLQRLIEMDLAAIDREALLFKGLCDVRRRYRAEQLAGRARLALERDHSLVQLRAELHRAVL